MQVKIYRSIQEISSESWDKMIPSSDIFHTHRFLLALEKSQVENALYQYVVFYSNETIVASAVLSVFTINLDLLIPKHPISSTLKRIFPNFFKVKICFCGTPVSIGQRNLIVSNEANHSDILPLLDNEINQFAKKSKARFVVFKEFYEKEAIEIEPIMKGLKYFRGYTLPYLKLPIRWKFFDEYVADMRSNYRRQLLTSWKKISDQKNSIEKPYLEIINPESYNSKAFYLLYESVLSRAAVKLEMLNEAFFQYFFEYMKDNTKLLSLVYQGKKLATVLMTSHGKELTFVWAGKPNATSEYDDYFNLMAGMVDFAIKNGYEILNFGQVAFYTKQRLGGETHQLCLFFKSYSTFWHKIILSLKDEFFPKIELEEKRVFRN